MAEWTPEETKRLFDLRRKGMEYADVAKALGRTRHSVKNKLYSTKNPERRYIRSSPLGEKASGITGQDLIDRRNRDRMIFENKLPGETLHDAMKRMGAL